MIISNDYKTVVLGPTKTGTRTVKNVLSPYGVFLEEHINYGRVIYNCLQKVPNFNLDGVENYYIFWRDPVERFISGINHFRSPAYIKFLIRFNPHWFTGIDLSPYSDGSDHEPGSPPMPDIPQAVLDECIAFAPQISPEQIFAEHRLFRNNQVLTKQAFWYNGIPTEKLFILLFSDFAIGLKHLAGLFGAPADVQIPKLNESSKITTSLSTSLEAEVRSYYAEDYELIR